jgi:hypothetical protein
VFTFALDGRSPSRGFGLWNEIRKYLIRRGPTNDRLRPRFFPYQPTNLGPTNAGPPAKEARSKQSGAAGGGAGARGGL